MKEGIKEITVRRLVFSIEMLLAVIVTAVVALTAYPGDGPFQEFSSILSTYSGVGAAMLGLIIAAYAIFISVGRPTYLRILVESGLYREAVTMFAWTGLVLVLATVLSLASLSFSGMSTTLMWGFFTAASFLVFYGVFCVGVLAVSSLRIISELRLDFMKQTDFKDQ